MMRYNRPLRHVGATAAQAVIFALMSGAAAQAAPLYSGSETSRLAVDRRPVTRSDDACNCDAHIVLAASRDELKRQLEEVQKELRRRKKEQARQERRKIEEQQQDENAERSEKKRLLQAAQEELARRRQAEEAQRLQQAEDAQRREIQRKLDEAQQELKRRQRLAEDTARQQQWETEASRKREQAERREKELQLRAAQEELKRRQQWAEEQSRREIGRRLETAKRELEARRQQQVEEQRQAEQTERLTAQRRLEAVQQEIARRKRQTDESQRQVEDVNNEEIKRKLAEAQRELAERQRVGGLSRPIDGTHVLPAQTVMTQRQRLLEEAKRELVERQREIADLQTNTQVTEAPKDNRSVSVSANTTTQDRDAEKYPTINLKFSEYNKNDRIQKWALEMLYNRRKKEKLTAYAPIISKAAIANSISPNLLRAILYEEIAHLGLGEEFREKIGIGRTVGPGQMTIGDQFGTRKELLDPEINIWRSAKHISNIAAKLDALGYPYDPALIGTIYNCGSCLDENMEDSNYTLNVSNYGYRIREFYNYYENNRE